MPPLALHFTRSTDSLSTLTTSGSFTSPSSPTFTQGEPLHRCLTRDSSSPSLASPLASTSSILYTDKHVTLTPSTLTLRGLSFPFGKETTIPLEKISSAGSSSSSAEPRGRVRVCGLWRRKSNRAGKSQIVVTVSGWMGKVGFKVECEEAWWAAWELARRAPKE
ncbi:hypothetical protein BCR35DRAFT_307603 [Leucosporidium creatinivorum]|uniref:Uncharacterized protein n=1 Tax=Leucosporidium creatinivorum TaxID=106004 RepID=A0A1Y2EP07_9BASI|nr:hypothetical protein BCR35DRAFT_307603 [Leucosporidium creatinivorum]